MSERKASPQKLPPEQLLSLTLGEPAALSFVAGTVRATADEGTVDAAERALHKVREAAKAHQTSPPPSADSRVAHALEHPHARTTTHLRLLISPQPRGAPRLPAPLHRTEL